jgi:hypothetical protein
MKALIGYLPERLEKFTKQSHSQSLVARKRFKPETNTNSEERIHCIDVMEK